VLDEVVLVTEEEIREAMRALLAGRVKLPAGTRVVSIVSGGNVDPARLATILEGRLS